MTTGLPAPDAASGSHRPPLNYYGELARRQWEGCLPEIYQQIRDPGAFFAVLGEVIAHRIDELADHLAGDDQHGEGYLARVARLTAARDLPGAHRCMRISAASACTAFASASRPSTDSRSARLCSDAESLSRKASG